jgi:hypothetical protein
LKFFLLLANVGRLRKTNIHQLICKYYSWGILPQDYYKVIKSSS